MWKIKTSKSYKRGIICSWKLFVLPIKWISTCCLLCWCGWLSAQSEAVGVTAWLEARESSYSGKTEIRAIIDNDSEYDINLRYELRLLKTSDTGTSKFRKSGEAHIATQKKKIVASNAFYTKKNQKYLAVFKLYNEVGVIFTDSLAFPEATNIAPKPIKPPILPEPPIVETTPPPTNDTTHTPAAAPITSMPLPQKEVDQHSAKVNPTTADNNPLPDSNTTDKNKDKDKSVAIAASPKKQIANIAVDLLEIDGLVIDETRTKIARDFYDLFYKSWVAPPGATGFSVYIKEQPTRGRGAQILITVNEQRVFLRHVPARYDDMVNVVNSAIRFTRSYLSRRGSVADQLNEEDQMGNGIY